MPDIGGAGAGSLSDIEFVRQKALDGDWITVTGAINALNDTIEYQPATGKTFFLYSAKIVMNANLAAVASFNATQTATDLTTAELKIDTVTVDTAHIGFSEKVSSSSPGGAGGGGGYGVNSESHFDCLGQSLVGDSSKVVEIENVLDSGSATATLSGWIEDT
jgi:hypothetical protein